MKPFPFLLSFSIFCSLTVTASEPAPPDLEQQFRTLPMESRRLTGPLFWMHGDESRERLESYVAKVAEGGNGSFTAESRPHSDWLGEGWYRDLAICLAAAKKHNLQMWIFDEKWWPSGEVGGKVPQRYGSKKLVATATNVTGPLRLSWPAFGAGNFVGGVAGRESEGALDGGTLRDLGPFVQNGALLWEVPAGTWKVMRFTWENRKSGARYLLDGASQDCVDWYLKTVYQPHYDRFKEDFGKTIAGYFYDEPETHGDWGTEVMKVLAERKVDWKKALVAYKFKLTSEEQAAALYQYLDAFAEAWGRTLFGGMTRWCREHEVKSIGHFLEHRNEYVNLDLCAGNMFQLQKYSDMGGIDAVFTQFKMGERVAQDAPCWQTPKMGSSITHAYGKPDDVTLVEIFGARGQDLTYPEMKWWADHMQVSGVNFTIPHSFNPRAPRDTDCPPYFYNGGFEPRWPLYRVFADYSSRLTLMLSGGRHIAPVALLYLGGSAHAGQRVLPDQMSEALQDALYDCDWIPYEVFEKDVTMGGGRLALRQEQYRILVVPAVEVIPYGSLVKAKEFFEAGGVVAAHGFLPSKSATLGRSAGEVSALRDAIWGAAQPGLSVCKTNAAGGRSYFLPERPSPEQLQAVWAGDAGVHPTCEVREGRTDHWLHVLHRVKEGRDLFFIANQNVTGPARRYRLLLEAPGNPEAWDAMRNEICAVPFKRVGARAEVDLMLEPNESVLLVFQETSRALPARRENRGQPRRVVTLAREARPARDHPEPVLERESTLAGCHWVWYPEGNPAQAAPAGPRYFRKGITIPAEARIARATFDGTCDNQLVLFINGQEAGRSDDSGEGWRQPVRWEVRARLRPGTNQLAILALNATDRPSPAGVIGRLRIDFETGQSMDVMIDRHWKAGRDEAAGWTTASFDDAGWPQARPVAQFGEGPWGRLGSQLTLSPAKASPFFARAEVAAQELREGSSRVYLEADTVTPEAALRVWINGQEAGGTIGHPLSIEVTQQLRAGSNEIRIEPFSPKTCRLAVYD